MSNSYEIDRILDETIIDQKPHYLIKWKNYSSTESTWEPIQNLLDELSLVHSWKVKNNATIAKNGKRKAKANHSSSQIEDEDQQEKFSMDYGRKKKSRGRRKLEIDDSNSSNNSLDELNSQQQQHDQLSFCQNMRAQKTRSRKKLKQKRAQVNSNQNQNRDVFDVNGFKKVGKVTKEDVKAILWCFDWQGDQFCQVQLKDGRKVHIKKEDVKKICPEILLEYYEKNERSHI